MKAMKATQFEFRFRLWISFALCILGFWSPWLRYGSLATPLTTTRLEIAGELSRWISLQTASDVLTLAAILLAAVGAVMRVWGTARISRLPSRWNYLGDLLFAMAIAIFMPPSGAAVFLLLSIVQFSRLTLLANPATQTPRISLGHAILAEAFYIAMTVAFAALAWSYNPTLLIQALLICFGLALVMRAFVPQIA